MSKDTMQRAEDRRRSGSSVALWVLAGYLFATLVPACLAWNGATPAIRLAVTAHVLSCLLVMAIAIRGGQPGALRVVGDWLPLIAVPFLYAELPILIAGTGASFHDATVQAWEQSLFGESPARTLAARWPWPALSEIVHLGYVAYYPLIYLPALWLYTRGRRADFERLNAVLATVVAVCFGLFVVFPVAGPRYLWPPVPAPDGMVRRFALALLAKGSSRGAAFPSSHVAVMAAQSLVLLRSERRLGFVVTPCALLVGLGAVYGGFHYAVDVLAGAGVGSAIAIGAMLTDSRSGN